MQQQSAYGQPQASYSQSQTAYNAPQPPMPSAQTPTTRPNTYGVQPQTAAYSQPQQQLAPQLASYGSGATALPAPAFGYGTPTAPSANTWGRMPGAAQSSAVGDTSPGVTAVDPVLAGIEQDIANIQQSNGPRGEIHTEYRSRAVKRACPSSAR
jgi:hypothetical protein